VIDINILRKLQIDELTPNRFLTFSPRGNQDKRFHATTKQGDLQYHFIREAVEERSKSSTYQSSRTIADIFSQSLGASRGLSEV
jgi:hypothetical protein